MREIKFRGISQMTLKWIYGAYLKVDNYEYIIEEDERVFESCGTYADAIDIEAIRIGTARQYTGLKDKNDIEIYFESDIVRAIVIDDYDGSVKFMDGVIYLNRKMYKLCIKGYEEFNLMFADDLEIIGNIHQSVDTQPNV